MDQAAYQDESATQAFLLQEPAICSICERELFDAIACSMLIHAKCTCSLVGEFHRCGLAVKRRVKRKAVEQAQEKQAKKMVK